MSQNKVIFLPSADGQTTRKGLLAESVWKPCQTAESDSERRINPLSRPHRDEICGSTHRSTRLAFDQSRRPRKLSCVLADTGLFRKSYRGELLRKGTPAKCIFCAERRYPIHQTSGMLSSVVTVSILCSSALADTVKSDCNHSADFVHMQAYSGGDAKTSDPSYVDRIKKGYLNKRRCHREGKGASL